MRADRLLVIILLLQNKGKLTAANLAKELGVSRRTILRDVEALSFAGIPIYAEGGNGGGIALDEHYRTSLTGLKEAEIRTLFISTHPQRLNDLGLGDAAQSTLLKLSASIPFAHQQSVAHIRQRILVDPDWWYYDTQQMPFWDNLVHAVYGDYCIAATYETHQGEVIERVLEPYSLVAKSSLWYLIARRDTDFRTYRVARFQQITLLDQGFKRQPDFDLPTYWRKHVQEFPNTMPAFRFTLQIAPDQLNFIQRIIPGHYTIESVPEGDWLTISIQLETMELARMLVFGLGTQAIVVEPLELQQAVLDTAQRLLDSHKANIGSERSGLEDTLN